MLNRETLGHLTSKHFKVVSFIQLFFIFACSNHSEECCSWMVSSNWFTSPILLYPVFWLWTKIKNPKLTIEAHIELWPWQCQCFLICCYNSSIFQTPCIATWIEEKATSILAETNGTLRHFAHPCQLLGLGLGCLFSMKYKNTTSYPKRDLSILE